MKSFTSEEFHSRWADFDPSEFIFYSPQALEKIGLEPEEKGFFLISGLPEWAAPNIHFWKSFEEKYSGLICIGVDGDENFICLEKQNMGRLVVVDKENHESVRYLNASISILCRTLLEYSEMVEASISKSEDAFSENSIPDISIDEFRSRIMAFDPDAVRLPNSFWSEEISRLLSHRKE